MSSNSDVEIVKIVSVSQKINHSAGFLPANEVVVSVVVVVGMARMCR